jgi:hypothetical protein
VNIFRKKLTGGYPELEDKGSWEDGQGVEPNWDDETIIDSTMRYTEEEQPQPKKRYVRTSSGSLGESQQEESREQETPQAEPQREYPSYTPGQIRAQESATAYQRERLEAERRALKRAERKAEKEEQRADKRFEWERSEASAKRRERVKKEVSGAAKGLQKFLTLGGMPATSAKQRGEFYFGKPNKDLYVPSTPSVTPIKRSPAGAAHKVDTSELKARTVLRGGEFARRLVEPPGRHSESFDLLRRLNTPSGNSPLEQLVLAEIKDNNDHDTMEHIKTEVSKKGYNRQDVEKAVKLLESRGFIEKQRPALPSGQPEYILR